MACTPQGPPGGRQWLLVLLALRYLLPIGGITYSDTKALIRLVAASRIPGERHVPPPQPSAEGLCPEVPTSPGRLPGKDSLFRSRNMSDSSADTRRQLNNTKLIRRAAASSVPSRSPETLEDPTSSWSPGARGQGWDPGGPSPSGQPVPHAQPHPPHSGLRHWPHPLMRTRQGTATTSQSSATQSTQETSVEHVWKMNSQTQSAPQPATTTPKLSLPQEQNSPLNDKTSTPITDSIHTSNRKELHIMTTDATTNTEHTDQSFTDKTNSATLGSSAFAVQGQQTSTTTSKTLTPTSQRHPTQGTRALSYSEDEKKGTGTGKGTLTTPGRSGPTLASAHTRSTDSPTPPFASTLGLSSAITPGQRSSTSGTAVGATGTSRQGTAPQPSSPTSSPRGPGTTALELASPSTDVALHSSATRAPALSRTPTGTLQATGTPPLWESSSGHALGYPAATSLPSAGLPASQGQTTPAPAATASGLTSAPEQSSRGRTTGASPAGGSRPTATAGTSHGGARATPPVTAKEQTVLSSAHTARSTALDTSGPTLAGQQPSPATRTAVTPATHRQATLSAAAPTTSSQDAGWETHASPATERSPLPGGSEPTGHSASPGTRVSPSAPPTGVSPALSRPAASSPGATAPAGLTQSTARPPTPTAASTSGPASAQAQPASAGLLGTHTTGWARTSPTTLAIFPLSSSSISPTPSFNVHSTRSGIDFGHITSMATNAKDPWTHKMSSSTTDDTSVSTVLPTLSGIESTVERITWLPSDTAHGGTVGPIRGPLTFTAPASPKGLSMGGTERAETAAKVLKTTSTASVTSGVSIPTLRTLTIPTSKQTASTSTGGITTATSTVAPGVPEMTALLAIRHREDTSVTVSKETPSPSSGEPETTASVVPSPGAETGAATQTPTVFSDESHTVVSLITHPAETRMPVSTATSKFPHSESDATLSVNTSPGTETSLAIPTATISPVTPGGTTSLATISRTHTGSAKLTRTPPDGQGSTTSLAADLGAQGSAITHSTVSPGVSQMGTSPGSSSGTETSTDSQILTVSPNWMDITVLRVTPSGTKASSAVPTLTILSGRSRTTTSWVTHSVETSPTVRRITPDFPRSESNTTPLITRSLMGETSPAVSASTVSTGGTNKVTLLVTSSRIAISTSIPNPTISAGVPETTSSLVTHPGPQTSSAIPTLTVSPGVPGTMTSLVTNSGEENGVVPTLMVSPGQPEVTASWVSHPESEASSSVPILTVLASEAYTTASLVTYPTETNSAVPQTTLSVPHSESNMTPLTTINPAEKVSSAVSSSTVLPEVPGVMTSLVSSSTAVASTGTPTLALSSSESKVPLPGVTYPGAVSSSAVQTLSISPGEPDPTASLVMLPAETSPTIPKTAPDFFHTGSNTTPLTSTSPEKEASSAVSTSGSGLPTSLLTSSGTRSSMFSTLTVLSGQQETTDSWVTHPGLETSSFVPTLSVSSGEPDTTASSVTHAAETSSTVFMTSPSFSHSETQSTTPTTIIPGVGSSSAVSTAITSSVVPDVVTSQVPTSGIDPKTTKPTLILSPSEPEITTTLVTSARTQTSSPIPTLAVSPSISEMTSLVSSSETETSTTTPISTVSSDQLDTTASWVTQPGSVASSAIPALSISPGVADIAASWVTHAAATSFPVSSTIPYFPHSVSDTTPLMTTSLGAEASSAVPTPTISPEVPGEMTSLVTSSGTVISTSTLALTHSSGEPGTTALMATHPGSSSSLPTVAASPGVSGIVTTLLTSSGAETSTAYPELTDDSQEPKTTASWVTYSGSEARPAIPTLTVVPSEADTTVSLVTHSVFTTAPEFPQSESDFTSSMTTSPGAKSSVAVPTTMISPRILGVVTSEVTNFGTDTSTVTSPLTPSLAETEISASAVASPEAQTSPTVPTFTVFSGEPAATSSVIHSLKTSTAVSRTTSVFSHSESDTTPSMASSPRAEASSSVPTMIGEPDVITSQVITGPPTSAPIPNMTLSPSEPETTALLITHPTEETSTEFPVSTIVPPSLETGAPPSIRPEVEMSTALPTQTASLGGSGTATSLLTSLVTEMGRTDLGPAVSSGIPVETASLSSPPGAETSMSTPMAAISPGLSEATSAWVTSPAAEASTGIPTLTAPPSIPWLPGTSTTNEPKTITSWSTETSSPATSGGLPDFSKTTVGPTKTSVTLEISTLPTTSHGEGVSPTATLKTTTMETTHLAATGSSPTTVQLTATFSTTAAGSPFASETTSEMHTLASESVTSATTEVSLLKIFTVNFTITNLTFQKDMGNPGSALFNITDRTLQLLLHALFKSSSIGPLYEGCRLTMLRAEKDETSTRIDGVCAYNPDPTGPQLDREQLYWELSQLTHSITQLGSYSLDRDSLYINGYNHRYWIPTKNTPMTSTFSPGSSAPMTSTPSSTAVGVSPVPVPFTVNFTITNLHYTPDMGRPGSLNFNFTEKVLNHLLEPLFKNTSIGTGYSGCRLALLRNEKNGAATGVDTVCTYQPHPMGPALERKQLYQELSQLTHGVTRLGSYALDTDSLYVNGYNRRHWTPTTNTPVPTTFSPGLLTSFIPSSTGASLSLVFFTLNFTITNLHHEKDMEYPGSELFNTTESILNRLLKSLFQKSSIGPLYSGCRLILLRPQKNRTATGVDAVCTHHPDPMGHELDRKKLYWELSHETHGVTELGSYTLDKNSLYVSGFTVQASTPTPSTAVTTTFLPWTSVAQDHFTSSTGETPFLVLFTVNFTVTNLEFKKNMEQPGSRRFNSTERILQKLLQPLFENSNLGSLYSGCRLASLRPEKDGAATRVDAICSYRPGPEGFRLDREQLYWELSQMTSGITRLDPYSLDRDSLYVNGYTHQTAALITSTPATSTVDVGTSGAPFSISRPMAPSPTLVPFTINLTITNLQFMPDMSHPGSSRFNKTEAILQHLLGPVMKNTSIGPLFSGCRLSSLRPEKDGSATRVDVICTHRSEPTSTGLDRERLYWELSRETHSITRLGRYILDRNSLYVNGYTHRFPTSIPTISVASTLTPSASASPASVSISTAQAPALLPFTTNFTILNLRYEDDMRHPGSLKFNFTERVLQKLLQALFRNSSLGSLYAGCRLASLRPEKDGAATRVDAICSHRPGPEGFRPDRERLYWELSQMTHGVTRLDAYTLNRDSLYVNGFTHRTSALITSTPATSTVDLRTSRAPFSISRPTAPSPVLIPFTINLTITNLQFMPDMSHPGSSRLNKTEAILQHLLGPVMKNTSIGPLFSGCRLSSLGPEKDGSATRVDVICTHRSEPTSTGLHRERLYWELSRETHSITRLGRYTLDRNSLYVNGYTHQYLTSTLSVSVASTVIPTTSSTLAPVPTAGPIPEPFTLTFTITNLEYEKNMHETGSQKFNFTERVLQKVLTPLFKKTSVGPLFAGCRLTSLRSERHGAATGVDATCTHYPDITGSGLDRERLYWELSYLTHGVTWLGSYSLDQNSLYVNGYTHQILATTARTSMTPTVSALIPTASSSSPTASSPTLVPFTLNFTITDMPYTENMQPLGSSEFNKTEKVLQGLLDPLLKNTSVGLLYSGCRLTLLRPKKHGAATGVDAVCTYHPKLTGPGLDREKLYWDLSQLTQGVTRLGPYTLQQDSLHVDGYTHQTEIVVPSAIGSPLVPFTLNFTITNVAYEKDMWPLGSWKFTNTEKVLQHLLRSLFKNTTIGPFYYGCRLTLLRPEKGGSATGVDTVCTYHPESMGPKLDREQLYGELSQLTQGITQLGHYTLEKNSLYVNGYTNRTAVATPSATGPPLVPFTFNFTITNLAYEKDMQPPGSWKFNNTEIILKQLLSPLFKNTAIGLLYTGCRLTLLSPKKNGSATGVDMLCSYHLDPSDPKLDREHLYQELSQLTHGITQLGSYTLEPNSLYVNGYTHQTAVTTPSTSAPTIVLVTLNFTVTNMHYTEEMGNPGSLKFNSTEKILQRQLRFLLSKTSVGPLYAGCQLAALRREKGGAATGVDVICTFHSNSTSSGPDREKLYRELSHETRGVTQLGHYTLDHNSLYVNGYTFGGTAAMPTTEAVHEELLTVNFTINNLRYSADMGHPGSLKFNITDTVMQHLLGPLLQRSSLGARHTGCRLTALRSVKNGAQTQVDILCTYQQSPSSLGLSAKQVFHELSRQTRGITRLGPYSLDKDSLYLNGYNEPGPKEPPTTPEPATTFLPSSTSVQPEATTAMGHHLQTLTLNFTISNLGYSPDMSNGSAKFSSTERILQHLLGSLLQKTSLGSFYTGCRLTFLRPEKDREATGVDILCTYHPDPMGSMLDRERLYWELSKLTHGITQLGNYSLDRDSLYVNGYTHQTSVTTPSGYVTQNASTWSEYQLSFHILNWNLSNPDPAFSEYTALLRDIEDKVTILYTGSQLQDVFQYCRLTNLTLDSKLVTIKLFFSSHLNPNLVKQVFLNKTLNASSYWLAATYQLTDLHVTEVKPSVTLPTEMPPSISSSQQFQLNFTITNLPYSQNVSRPDSAQYQRNKRSIESALNQLFRNSSIKSYFSDCQVSAFRPVSHINHTGVDSVCNFSPFARRLDRVAIYEEFLRLTQNGTQLQNFTLDKNSVLVDGYSPIKNDGVTRNSDLPFWAIILICLAGLLAFITCLLCCYLVAICRRKKEGDYQVQRHRLGYYFPHLDLRKLQ
ncbi:PREDICTED: mucin-16 isoform X1 [Chinchilla lanigera]|nr:PREDICTED: mucin-16 isoform X1 [Chinchilla lanigera]